MTPAQIPVDEAERLANLRSYEILDTRAAAEFDDLTDLTAAILDTPIALVSFVDADRQWFKSHHGLAARETSREVAFCAHAILQKPTFVVEDASLDARFSDNPLVAGTLGIRFYAGQRLVTPEGHAVGTLCAIDRVPRTLKPAQYIALGQISRQVVALLELHRFRRQAARAAELAERPQAPDAVAGPRPAA